MSNKIFPYTLAFFLFVLLGFGTDLSAQSHSATEAASPPVQSDAFGKMLKHMLSHSVEEVTPAEVNTALQSGEVVLLDAREPSEYAVSQIQSARLVGYDSFSMSEVEDIPRDAKVVVYCSIGYRSEKISEQLLDAGFSDVSNLYGGIFEWVNQGFPVYNDGEITDDVHAYNRAWGLWLTSGDKKYNR